MSFFTGTFVETIYLTATRSLVRRALVPLVLLALFATGITASNIAQKRKQLIEESIEKKAATYLAITQKAVLESVWKLNAGEAFQILSALAEDEDFSSGIITDEKGGKRLSGQHEP